MIDKENRKVFENKEKVFREYQRDVFRNMPEDNANFNLDHEREINNFLRENHDVFSPYNHADLSRLNVNDYLTRPVEIEQIKNVIKQMKQHKAPGKSKINKIILENLPDAMLNEYFLFFIAIMKQNLEVLIIAINSNSNLNLNFD